MNGIGHCTKYLELFKAQYLQLIGLNDLAWPAIHQVPLADANVQSWLFENLFDAERVTFRPPERYQLRVLKELVSRIENYIQDPDEQVGIDFVWPKACVSHFEEYM